MDTYTRKTILWNYRAGTHDEIDGAIFEMSDEQIVNYVPQMGGVGMYNCLREMGWTKKDAYLRVLHASLGETYERSANE